MRLRQIIVIFLLVFLLSHPVPGAAGEENISVLVTEAIRQRMADHTLTEQFVCHGEMICGISLIPLFYEKRGYKPAWMDPSGSFSGAGQLVKVLNETDREGLDPHGYHPDAIRRLFSRINGTSAGGPPPGICADLDILLTDAFLFYASHLISGRVNPETIHSSWEAFSPRVDLIRVLEEALESGNVRDSLESLIPRHAGYAGLRHMLKAYREIAKNGGWPKIPVGRTLKPGMTDMRMNEVVRLLVLTRDLADEDAPKTDLYAGEVVAAVRRFQQHHGLADDGVIGPKTLAAMNVPVEVRIRQIGLNMERWRWIPRDLGERYILVNIADFSLEMVEKNKTLAVMRVIAGRPYRKTPVFSGEMKFMVLNPYWNVPRSIAVKDLIPRACRNTDYLFEKKIRVFESWADSAAEIDARTVDWCRADRRTFPYRLRQDPGPENSLGRIKFIFPNPYSVYLHDTPERGLFDRVSRDFSSGCIRVEKPVELAALILNGQDGWTRERLRAGIQEGNRRVIPIRDRVFIHVLYLTSWVDTEGTVHFAEDIYERDSTLEKALAEKPSREFNELKRMPDNT